MKKKSHGKLSMKVWIKEGIGGTWVKQGVAFQEGSMAAEGALRTGAGGWRTAGGSAGTGTMIKERVDDSNVAGCSEQGGVWCRIRVLDKGQTPESRRLKVDFRLRE